MTGCMAEGFVPEGYDAESWGEILIEVFYMEKRVNRCYEYEDAFVFENTRKKHGDYNPVVLMKESEEMLPFIIYHPTKLLRTFDIPKQSWNV